MNFTLKILGTASALPSVGRYPSAQVLDVRGHLFLIDCGEGVQVQMRKYSVSFNKIEAIFISHLHGDHIFGLFGLLSTMSMLGRKADLKIFACKSFSSILDFYLKNFGDGLSFHIDFVSINPSRPQLIFKTRNLQCYAFALRHRVETYGFLFREKEPGLNVIKEKIVREELKLCEIAKLKAGEDVIREDGQVLRYKDYTYIPYESRSYAYCSDTMPFDELPEWVRDVDVLYHEATYPSEMTDKAALRGHSTTLQAAQVAAKAGAKKLIIGHFSSKYQNLSLFLQECTSVFKDTELAQEGKVVDILIKKLG